MSLLALLLAVTLQASVQSEGRRGSPGVNLPSGSELTAGGSFGLEESLGGWSGGLAYTPLLLLTQTRRGDLSNGGTLRLGFTPWKGLRFSATESFKYGRQDFSPLAVAAAGTGSAGGSLPLVAPVARILDVIYSSTSVRVEEQFSRVLSGSLAGTYTWGGAVGAEGRGYLPQSRQPGFSATLGWVLSRRDTLSANAEGRISSSDNGATSNFASLNAGLARRFSRAAQGSLVIGLSWTESRLTPRTQHVWGLLPNFAASTTLAPFKDLTCAASTGLSPALDPATGTANTNAAFNADVSWHIDRKATLSAGAGWLRVVQGSLTGSETRQASLRLTVPLDGGLSLGAGFQAIDLHPVGPGSLAGGLQWLASVQLGWAARSNL